MKTTPLLEEINTKVTKESNNERVELYIELEMQAFFLLCHAYPPLLFWPEF